MALPPNGLICLLVDAGAPLTSPEAVYETLRQANCLSAAGLAERDAVIALIASYLATAGIGPPTYAASSADRYTAHLTHASPYLNRKGQRLGALRPGEYDDWKARGKPPEVFEPTRDLNWKRNPISRLAARLLRRLRPD